MLIPDYEAALKGMFRVLRRDGKVAVTAWKSQGHWDYLVRAARLVFQDPGYPAPRFFDEKWLSGKFVGKLLTRRGFRYYLELD
jgi:ubiquinone/menaquinone biosynthesis C-methylase UbiE